jgi:pyruvate dehydrogenase (quinone)
MVTIAAQTALTQRGVAVLIVPDDVSALEVEEGPNYSVHVPAPVIQPSDAELDQVAALLNRGERVAVYAGAGCERAHDQLVRFCETMKAPMAHTSRAKDFVEHANPYNVGMNGVFGSIAGLNAVTRCDTLLLLGCDFCLATVLSEACASDPDRHQCVSPGPPASGGYRGGGRYRADLGRLASQTPPSRRPLLPG